MADGQGSNTKQAPADFNEFMKGKPELVGPCWGCSSAGSVGLASWHKAGSIAGIT